MSDYHDGASRHQVGATLTDSENLCSNAMDPVSGITSGNATAQLGTGWMRASAGGSASSMPPPGPPAVHAPSSATSSADMAFSDLIVISSPGLSGQAGMVHASATRTLGGPDLGTAGGEGPGGWARRTTYNVLSFTSNRMTTHYESLDPSNFPFASYDGGQLGRVRIDIMLPFTFGQVFGFEDYGDASSAAGAGVPVLLPSDPLYHAPRFAQSNESLSMQWDGIDSVTLDNPGAGDAAPATDAATPLAYTLVSGSGADYTRAISAVPEPPMALLLGVGFPLVACTRRACVSPFSRQMPA